MSVNVPPRPGTTGELLRPGWELERVQPPGWLIVDPGDFLTLSHWSSRGDTVRVKARVLLFDGQITHINQTFAESATRAQVVSRGALPGGFLIAAEAHALNLSRRGQLYGELTIQRGNEGEESIIQVLSTGYIYTGRNLFWPPGFAEGYTDGPGLLRALTGTDPGVGAEILETVPTNARWRLRAMRIRLVTSGVGGARTVVVIVDDGTGVVGTIPLYHFPSPATQAISLTRDYWFHSAGQTPTAFTAARITIPTPEEVMLFQGFRINTFTDALDGADNYAAPQLYLEEWIEE